MKILQPPDWLAPRGYANGTMTEMTVGSRMVFVGGQIGWNGQQQFESDDLADQVRQTLANIVAILAEGGARPEHIVRMTWYVTDKKEYVAAYPA
jgi:enamine deaminase RidA (YjgF/YER057c/UK114 family)